MSLSGRGVSLLIGFASHLPFLRVAKPFSISLLPSSLNGASIIMFPPGNLRLLILCFTICFFSIIPLSRVILVPRNLAFPYLACVIKVFSSDSSSFHSARNFDIRLLVDIARFFGPQIPMSQSSAYLTYSIFLCSGLHLRDFTFHLIFISSLYFSFNCVISAPTFLKAIIFYFVARACPSNR